MKLFNLLFVLFISASAFAQPTASFTVSDNIICAGDCIDVDNTSSNGVVASTWSFGGAIPSFYSGANPGQVCYSGAGTFTITLTVTDAGGLTSSSSQSVTVGTAAMGTNFTNVRTIIHAKCGSCHLNGGNTAGYNFDNDCSIVTYWNQIKGTCVQPYSRPQMPPSAPLTSTQQSQITAWINAGHGYTN